MLGTWDQRVKKERKERERAMNQNLLFITTSLLQKACSTHEKVIFSTNFLGCLPRIHWAMLFNLLIRAHRCCSGVDNSLFIAPSVYCQLLFPGHFLCCFWFVISLSSPMTLITTLKCMIFLSIAFTLFKSQNVLRIFSHNHKSWIVQWESKLHPPLSVLHEIPLGTVFSQ